MEVPDKIDEKGYVIVLYGETASWFEAARRCVVGVNFVRKDGVRSKMVVAKYQDGVLVDVYDEKENFIGYVLRRPREALGSRDGVGGDGVGGEEQFRAVRL